MFSRRLNDAATVTIAVTLFSLIFAILLMVYIYLMQRSWMISRTSVYLYEEPLVAGYIMALYDIHTGRYRNGVGSGMFYVNKWSGSADKGYSVTYNVPVEITFENTSCGDMLLAGRENCVKIKKIIEAKQVHVRYSKDNGHWKIKVKEL